MTAQSQHGAPPAQPPASRDDAPTSQPDAGRSDLRREVETLPDGRRITYYASAPR